MDQAPQKVIRDIPQSLDGLMQYGPNLLGFATYLHSAHLIPYARCAKIVQEVTGAPFSPGSLHRALRSAYVHLASFEQSIKEALADATTTPVKHVDETGGNDQAFGIQNLSPWRFETSAHGGDEAVQDQHIGGFVSVRGGVDDAAVLDEKL